MTTLFHFCPAHMVESIRVNGLSRGKLPIIYPAGQKLIPRCQWLTTDGDPERQSWATSHLIHYSRTAYRLTVEIPAQEKKRLHRAIDFMKRYPVEARGVVEGWAGSEHWFIFKGIIPPDWIKEIVRMEGSGAQEEAAT